MVTKAKVWIADASHILWIEHICWSYLAEGFLVESIPLIINHQTRIREDIIELNQTIDLEPCCQNISSISRDQYLQRPAGVYTLQQVQYRGWDITRHQSVRKIPQKYMQTREVV